MAILVDFNPVVIASVHVASSEFRGDVDIGAIRHLFFNSILDYSKKFKSKYGEFVICVDSRDSWRKDTFPYYKCNRAKSKANSQIDWNVVYEAMDTIKQELSESWPYKVVEVPRAEADDIIGVLCHWWQHNELVEDPMFGDDQPQDVMIVSSDKDFIQLQRLKNVYQYSPNKKKLLSHARPDLFLREHIIRGEPKTGDAIPNINSQDDSFVMGVRQKPVTSKKMDEWLAMDNEAFFEDLTEDQINRFNRNQILVDLRWTPESIKEQIIEAYKAAPQAPRAGLLNYFMKNKLRNLMEDIARF